MQAPDDVEFKLNPSLQLSIAYEARRRGKPRIRQELDPSARLLPVLAELLSSRDPSQLIRGYSLPVKQSLAELGILVATGEEAKQVLCDLKLDSTVFDALPASALPAMESLLHERLEINPTLSLEEYSRPLSNDAFTSKTAFPSPPVAWIQDPGTEMMWPIDLDEEQRDLILALQQGRLSMDALSSETKRLMVLAEVLVPSGWASRRKSKWGVRITGPYAILREIVPTFHLARLRQFYRALEAEGYLLLDIYNPKRYLEINERVTQFVHRQAGRLIRRATGESLIPAFCYISPYLEGAELPRHIDNAQCRWNGSLLIDMIPETPIGESWPLYLGEPGSEGIRLGMGDCVIYKGSEIPHWREALPADYRQTLLLFHYASIDFMEDLLGPTRLGSGGGGEIPRK